MAPAYEPPPRPFPAAATTAPAPAPAPLTTADAIAAWVAEAQQGAVVEAPGAGAGQELSVYEEMGYRVRCP